MKTRSAVLVLAGLMLACRPAAATVTTLTTLPAPFSWAYFGGALAIAQIHTVTFLAPAGSTTAIQTVSTPVYAAVAGPSDGDPAFACTGGIRCEQIGNLQFQYALWQGTYGRGSTPNRVGAVVFGGFQLTDPADVNGAFSFLQTYADSSAPTGTIDGGGFDGKVNGQIPGWQSNPGALGGGWNYMANGPISVLRRAVRLCPR